MVHSVSGWRRGVLVKRWDPLRTSAIPERLRGVITTRRYTNPHSPLPLPSRLVCCLWRVVSNRPSRQLRRCWLILPLHRITASRMLLLAGSVSGRLHSKWWWCHDIGYPLLAAEHSLCKAPQSGKPCLMISAHSRTMSPFTQRLKTWLFSSY